MDFHLQNEPPSQGALRRREKVSDHGPAQRKWNKHGMQKAVTLPVLPSMATSWWLPSRHGSHCSHLSFSPESQISQAVVISTLTLLSLEMWPWDIHSCPWKSGSPDCVLLILTEGFHCFSYLGSPLEGASLEHWLGSSGLLNHPWSLKTTYHFLLVFFFFLNLNVPLNLNLNLKTLETQEQYPFFFLPGVPKTNCQQQNPTAVLSRNTFSFEGASWI